MLELAALLVIPLCADELGQGLLVLRRQSGSVRLLLRQREVVVLELVAHLARPQVPWAERFHTGAIGCPLGKSVRSSSKISAWPCRWLV